jgi:hypothetical protein
MKLIQVYYRYEEVNYFLPFSLFPPSFSLRFSLLPAIFSCAFFICFPLSLFSKC